VTVLSFASRLLADEVIHVYVDYIITPPTNQTMTALFGQVLRPGIASSTAALGLAMEAKYLNSTIRLVKTSPVVTQTPLYKLSKSLQAQDQ
jgi:hypothetical protein